MLAKTYMINNRLKDFDHRFDIWVGNQYSGHSDVVFPLKLTKLPTLYFPLFGYYLLGCAKSFQRQPAAAYLNRRDPRLRV